MSNTLIPEVTWAQRSNANDAEKNIVYMTIICPDVEAENLKVDLQSTKLSFAATNKKGTSYGVELEFFAEIDVECSKQHHSPRGLELILRKKEQKSEYWPRLLKDSKRMHFLKTDFDKWVDEDEQEEVPEDPMGGGMGGGFPGGDEPGFGGLDFSKLSGMGGMGGMGDMSSMMGGMGGDGDEDDDDDEDMPGLEDTTPATEKPAEGSKAPIIQEISDDKAPTEETKA